MKVMKVLMVLLYVTCESALAEDDPLREEREAIAHIEKLAQSASKKDRVFAASFLHRRFATSNTVDKMTPKRLRRVQKSALAVVFSWCSFMAAKKRIIKLEWGQTERD